jgi:metacaspase-1
MQFPGAHVAHLTGATSRTEYWRLVVEHRIVWVHGIGDHKAGYSDPWRQNFNTYLKLPHASYVEVVWETVFETTRQRATRGRGQPTGPVSMTRMEQLEEAEIREQVQVILQARASALQEGSASAPATRGRRGAGQEVLEWSRLRKGPRKRGFLDWLSQPDEYLGDFAKYLASKALRTAVKEEVKKKLRPLVEAEHRVSVVSHSWGTVVAYDALLDLAVELPTLRVAQLFTLGSPLWAVRRFLEDSTGQKPAEVELWMNIEARGDPVGSWLSPAFRVDRDFQVPSFGPGDPHGSYFAEGNEAVQGNLVAKTILG